MAFEPREDDEIFLSPAQEEAAEAREEWFNDCAFHEAVLAIRSIIRAAKSDDFDAEKFHEAVFDHMQGTDAWDQAVAAEQTTAERHQAYSEAVNLMLGGK